MQKDAIEARAKADEATIRYEDCEARAEAHAAALTSDLERRHTLEAQRELVAHLRESLAKTNTELSERLDEVESAKRLAGAEAEVALAAAREDNRELRSQQLAHRLELLRRGDALGSARLNLAELEQTYSSAAKMLQARVIVLSNALDDAYAAEKSKRLPMENPRLP